MKTMKLTAVLAAAFLLCGVLATTGFAYAPERYTYASNRVADVPIFNSMVWREGVDETPLITDERNFVWIRECKVDDPHDLTQIDKGPDSNPFKTTQMKIEAGKTYEVSVYYHNNASANHNDPETGSSVMKGAKLKVLLPDIIKAGKSVRIVGELSGDNMVVYAPDGETVLGNWVQDDVTVTADEKIELRYIPGSARIDNSNIRPTITENGATLVNPASVLDDAFLTGVDINGNKRRANGALFGSEELDGIVFGCTEHQGWIRFRFDAVKAKSTLMDSLHQFFERDNIEYLSWVAGILIACGTAVAFVARYIRKKRG